MFAQGPTRIHYGRHKPRGNQKKPTSEVGLNLLGSKGREPPSCWWRGNIKTPKVCALSDNAALTNELRGTDVQPALQPPLSAVSSARALPGRRGSPAQRRDSGDCGMRTLAGRGKNCLYKFRRD